MILNPFIITFEKKAYKHILSRSSGAEYVCMSRWVERAQFVNWYQRYAVMQFHLIMDFIQHSK